jgi:GNAT superfamily N-acetyltransferase
MEIRALRASDDRSRFASGDESLDRFFRVYAGQNQFRHHLGVTYVAIEAQVVVGYATVAPGELAADRLPAADRKRLPGYPMPVLRLARLAVDRAVQSQGLGKLLLRFVLELAAKLATDVGCAGLVVDAKPPAIRFYERFGFRSCDSVVEGASEARPQPTLMFLPTRLILEARSKRRR